MILTGSLHTARSDDGGWWILIFRFAGACQKLFCCSIVRSLTFIGLEALGQLRPEL